jgi:WD40 repeat protein
MVRSRKFRPPSVGPSYEMRFDSTGSRFACVGRSIVIWDLASGIRLTKHHPFKHPDHVDWSPDGDQLAVKSTSGKLVIVDPNEPSSEARWLRKRGKEGCEIAFSACGNFLVDCNWDGRVDVFDLRTGEVAHSETINHAMITSLAYSRSRAWFAYVVCPKAAENGFPSKADYLVVRKWPFWDNRAVVVPTESHDIEAIAFSPGEQAIVLAVSGPGRETARLKIVHLVLLC